MTLSSPRLTLILVTWDDLDDIHRLHSVPEVDEFNTLGIPESIEVTREVMRPAIEGEQADPQRTLAWKIILTETGEFIGLAGMSLSCDRFRLGEMYYKLYPDFWGRGYATEVCKTLIRAGFDKFNLHRVEAGVATENIRSVRVLEKSGMTREGLLRKILPIRGTWVDNYHYAIVEDDPRED